MTNLAKAITFATLKHDGQTRRDGSPYIYHPLGMAQILKEQGHGEDVQIVAILHDVLEDTDATEEEILAFGEDILKAVKLLTREKGADEEIYLQHILENEYAKIVKEADKLYNMKDLLTCKDEKFVAKYVKKSKEHYYGKFSKEVDDAIDAAAKYLEEMTAKS